MNNNVFCKVFVEVSVVLSDYHCEDHHFGGNVVIKKKIDIGWQLDEEANLTKVDKNIHEDLLAENFMIVVDVIPKKIHVKDKIDIEGQVVKVLFVDLYSIIDNGGIEI